MNSMTGFGKAELTIDGRRMRVEIKSVNQRFLDINVRMPRFLMFLEEAVRKQIQQSLERGRVEVFINYASERDDAKKVTVNQGMIRSYYEAAQAISSELSIPGDIGVIDLMRLPDAVTIEEREQDDSALAELTQKTLAAALEELLSARRKEGEKLMSDITARLSDILEFSKQIAQKEQTVVAEYRDKLTERISVLLSNQPVDEARIAQEVAIFADKCNITEEVVRIQSHVAQFLDADNQSGPQGRNLDFIVQELNREFNTIGSKSGDVEITNLVIRGKAEIEKIREQIQNIE